MARKISVLNSAVKVDDVTLGINDEGKLYIKQIPLVNQDNIGYAINYIDSTADEYIVYRDDTTTFNTPIEFTVPNNAILKNKKLKFGFEYKRNSYGNISASIYKNNVFVQTHSGYTSTNGEWENAYTDIEISSGDIIKIQCLHYVGKLKIYGDVGRLIPRNPFEVVE